jgi:hypothetical protein
MISIVCVYNNPDILNTYLMRGLNHQTSTYELILLDNTAGQFHSAAKALNEGGKKATSEYILFSHQDVYLPTASWLEEAEGHLKSIPSLGIAGIAGMIAGGSDNETRGRNMIKHGEPHRDWSWGRVIMEPIPVQTLDECLVIIPRSVFNRYPFDAITCMYWDLYAVDYCLTSSQRNLGVYVLPLMIHHGSLGRLTKNYFVTLKKVLEKHRIHVDRINTTVNSWQTGSPLGMQRLNKWIADFLRRVQRKIYQEIR